MVPVSEPASDSSWSAKGMRFVEANRGDDTRCDRDETNGDERAADAERIGQNAGYNCANDVAEVSPESVYANGSPTPRWTRDVTDSGEERRIHHRGSNPKGRQ